MKDLLEKLRPVFNAEGGGDGGGTPDASASASADASAGGGTVLGADGVEQGSDKPGSLSDSMYSSDDKSKENKGGEEAKTDEEKAAAAKAEEDAKAKKKEGEDVAALKAEDITFDLPEGFELDTAVADEFKSFAVENKLTLDQVKTLQGLQAKLYEKQTEAHAQTVAKWGADLKSDKEIGGKAYDENVGYATAAVQEFFSPEALRMLDVTGLGNHPDIVKGFVRMGKAMGEGRSHKGTGSQSRTSIVDAMYGDS